MGTALREYHFPYTSTVTFILQTDIEIIRKLMNRKLGDINSGAGHSNRCVLHEDVTVESGALMENNTSSASFECQLSKCYINSE